MGLQTITHTIDDVMTDVKRTFGDESAIQITDTDIIRWTNNAQREILITNKIYHATGTTDIVAGVSEYSITNLNIVNIKSIHYKGMKVVGRTFQEAEEYIESKDPLLTASGPPALWYEWGGIVNLYPVPDETIVDGLKIYYVKEPIAITAVGEALSVPDAYYENVLQFVLAKAYELDEDLTNSQAKMGQFTQRLTSLADQENAAGQDTYPRIFIREEDM